MALGFTLGRVWDVSWDLSLWGSLPLELSLLGSLPSDLQGSLSTSPQQNLPWTSSLWGLVHSKQSWKPTQIQFSKFIPAGKWGDGFLKPRVALAGKTPRCESPAQLQLLRLRKNLQHPPFIGTQLPVTPAKSNLIKSKHFVPSNLSNCSVFTVVCHSCCGIWQSGVSKDGFPRTRMKNSNLQPRNSI